ncbi:KR domain-containing protein [Daldinia sp. FL1419]|nr:KR domain-containing protein [Daldinia sp. FL1419]
MPLIKGCVQSSMAMTKDLGTRFLKDKFADWKAALDPKVRWSWDLHEELPKGLNFFILISSMMAAIGGPSLSAYRVANSYMDALVRYRVYKGELTVVIGLGVVPDGGHLIEYSEWLVDVEGTENVCLPVYWCDHEEILRAYFQPFWGHMHHIPALASDAQKQDEFGDNTIKARRKRALDTAARVAVISSLAEAADIASEAVAQRTSATLGTAIDRLDPQGSMLSYGVDSLSAVDIRNWMGQVFDVDLPVFEIFGAANFVSIGLSIARKAQLKR